LSRCKRDHPVLISSPADLQRVRGAWDDCRASRDRNAIYGYLTAVYGLMAWWTAEGHEVGRARRALRSQRLKVSDREDPFASVIYCTADPAKADKRTRSKWSRVLHYATAYKPNAEALERFIRRKGGINACEARFSHRFGRRAGKGANNGEDGAANSAKPLRVVKASARS
jgi:hypothetical protein